MIETRVEFKGLEAIEAALRALPVEMQLTVLRQGIKRGADVFRRGMEQRAPRSAKHRVIRRGKAYPKRLAEAIITRRQVSKEGDPGMTVGPSDAAFWGGWVERGTRFMRAQPYMRPTFQADGQIAVAAFAAGVKDALEALLRKLSSPAGGK